MVEQEGGDRETKHVQQLRTLTTFSEDLSSVPSSKSGSSQLPLPPALGDMTLSLVSGLYGHPHTCGIYTLYIHTHIQTNKNFKNKN